MTVMDPESRVEPPLPPPQGGVRSRRYCFSGDGTLTSRRWSPGRDTRYRERLRNAYANGRLVPDPWVIAETTGREAVLPEGWDAWPTMTPLDVARRLDRERVNADPYATPDHWEGWLYFTERKQAERQERARIAEERPSAHREQAKREAAEQMSRAAPQSEGYAVLDPAEPDQRHRVIVVDLADRYRLIVRKLDDPADTRQHLIYDSQFEADQAQDLDDPDSGEPLTSDEEGR
jgi:hypothetical protein